jgi:hypothetical protein
VSKKRLNEDAKMMIAWDVYCHHRYRDLLSSMRNNYPAMFVNFVPANLTEIGLPLDRYSNAVQKTITFRHHDQRIRKQCTAHMAYEKLRKKEAMEEVSHRVPKIFQPDTKLSEIKEQFFLDIAAALKEMQ